MRFTLTYFVPVYEFSAVFTSQKMKFSIKDFFSKCDQIRSFQQIWSHLLKKSLMENFIFCVVILNHLIITYYANMFTALFESLIYITLDSKYSYNRPYIPDSHALQIKIICSIVNESQKHCEICIQCFVKEEYQALAMKN